MATVSEETKCNSTLHSRISAWREYQRKKKKRQSAWEEHKKHIKEHSG
ncbi:MAG: hypothetical protein ACFFBD_15530 [Candidatus Hodarchaeota archaeon]